MTPLTYSSLLLASIVVLAAALLDAGVEILLIGGLAMLCSLLAALALLLAGLMLWPLRRRCFGDWL